MITETQRVERRQFLGSSDCAAICGLDPWRSPYDVYLSKTQDLADSTSDAMEAGNHLEPVVLDWAERRLNRGALLRDRRFIASNKICAVNLDAQTSDYLCIVEAKTSGITGPLVAEWGEDGSEDVPDHVYVQVQFQLAVAGGQEAKVAALIGGRGFSLFTIKPDDNTQGMLIERAERFWRDHVLTRIPPSDSTPSLEIAKRIRRAPGKVIQIPSVNPVLSWQNAKLALEQAVLLKDVAEAVLLSLLGDAEAADTPAGQLRYLQENAGKRINLDRLKAERPEVYEKYAEPTTRRCLRLKAPKALPTVPERKQLVKA